MGRVSRIDPGRRYYRRNKEAIIKRNAQYRREHADEVNARIAKKNRVARERGTTCEILQRHHEEHSDDENRLTTEFMQRLIGSVCKGTDEI